MDIEKYFEASSLRRCAHVALEKMGFVVRNKPGLGVAPGARLWIQRSGQPKRAVVVRVSKKRRIGISRHRWRGNWFEVPDLKEVVVVAPSLDNPMQADVYVFDAKKLEKIFDHLDTQRNGPFHQDRKLNFPIFAALDPQVGDASTSSNLKEEAEWHETVSLHVSLASTPTKPVGSTKLSKRSPHSSDLKGGNEGFLEKMRREYAELNGVDVRKVFINIRYVEE